MSEAANAQLFHWTLRSPLARQQRLCEGLAAGALEHAPSRRPAAIDAGAMEFRGGAEELKPLPFADRRSSGDSAPTAWVCAAMFSGSPCGEQLVLRVAMTRQTRTLLGRLQPVGHPGNRTPRDPRHPGVHGSAETSDREPAPEQHITARKLVAQGGSYPRRKARPTLGPRSPTRPDRSASPPRGGRQATRPREASPTERLGHMSAFRRKP